MFPLVNSIRIHRSFSSPLSKKAKYPLPSAQNQVSSSVWQYGYVPGKTPWFVKKKRIRFCFVLFVFVLFVCFCFCLFVLFLFVFVFVFRFCFVSFCFVLFCFLFIGFVFLQCANATPNTWSKPNGKIAEEPKNQCCLMCWCNSLRLT